MKQVFVEGPVSINQSVLLDDAQAHHLFDVLRTTSKETVRVVSGESVYLAHTEEKPSLFIFQQEIVQPRLVDVTLCFSLIKQDKFEWMLQKVTELGVSRIVPFVSRRSVVRIEPAKLSRKMQRWASILESAAKQCNRIDFVQLEPVCVLKNLEQYKSKINLVAYEKEDGSHHLANYLSDIPESVTMVIGPEGGFDPEEIEELVKEGFVPCSLGPQILRAETAACYVLSAVEYQTHCSCGKAES